LGACGKNETRNQNVLIWNDDNYTLFTIWAQKIWIMKHEGSETFLSFENVYDQKWNLIFMKWWVYYIENYKGFKKQKKVDLNEEKQIEVNPIRPFTLKWYEKLMENF
jgi:hypothetical protein